MGCPAAVVCTVATTPTEAAVARYVTSSATPTARGGFLEAVVKTIRSLGATTNPHFCLLAARPDDGDDYHALGSQVAIPTAPARLPTVGSPRGGTGFGFSGRDDPSTCALIPGESSAHALPPAGGAARWR